MDLSVDVESARQCLKAAIECRELPKIADAVAKMQAVDAHDPLIQDGVTFVRCLHVSLFDFS
jgi:hypothetical protein